MKVLFNAKMNKIIVVTNRNIKIERRKLDKIKLYIYIEKMAWKMYIYIFILKNIMILR
jgi:hypothetical protein